jgi:hypothetical protein
MKERELLFYMLYEYDVDNEKYVSNFVMLIINK